MAPCLLRQPEHAPIERRLGDAGRALSWAELVEFVDLSQLGARSANTPVAGFVGFGTRVQLVDLLRAQACPRV